MSIGRSNQTLSRSQALSKISKEVGFPNPSPESLTLYFDAVPDDRAIDSDKCRYLPKVDIATVAVELNRRGLIQELKDIIKHSGRDVPEFRETMEDIRAVVESYYAT